MKNKQSEVTTASFKRLAKTLRKLARENKLKFCLPLIARALDAEAKFIRSKP